MTHLICILNSENVLATVSPGEQVVEKRGSQAAEVELACRRRRIAHPHRPCDWTGIRNHDYIERGGLCSNLCTSAAVRAAWQTFEYLIALKMASSRLAGKVAVITGTAAGIGASSARQFAAAGARVLCVDLNEEAGRQVVEAINEAQGSEVARFVRADISKDEDAKAMIAAAEEAFGGVHVLFNNAGAWRGWLRVRSCGRNAHPRRSPPSRCRCHAER